MTSRLGAFRLECNKEIDRHSFQLFGISIADLIRWLPIIVLSLWIPYPVLDDITMGFDILKPFTISSILSGCGESDLLSDRTLMKNSRLLSNWASSSERCMQPCPAIHVELKRRWERNIPDRKKKGSLNYMGVDIGKRNCVVCIMGSISRFLELRDYNG